MESSDSELTCPFGENCKQPKGRRYTDKNLVLSTLTKEMKDTLSQRAISAGFRMYSCPYHKSNQYAVDEEEKYQRV